MGSLHSNPGLLGLPWHYLSLGGDGREGSDSVPCNSALGLQVTSFHLPCARRMCKGPAKVKWGKLWAQSLYIKYKIHFLVRVNHENALFTKWRQKPPQVLLVEYLVLQCGVRFTKSCSSLLQISIAFATNTYESPIKLIGKPILA